MGEVHGSAGLSLIRRIPAALLFSAILQLAGVLIWATELEARVNVLERQSVNAAMLNEKFARLDERLEYLKQELETVHRQLEQMSKRPR